MNFLFLDDISAAGDKAELLCVSHCLAWNLRLAIKQAATQLCNCAEQVARQALRLPCSS
jgi:hypothetical protein